MASTVILCTDGSDLALQALRTGLALLRQPDRMVVATVVELADETLVTGVSGFAGGAMSQAQFDELRRESFAAGEHVVGQTVDALGLDGTETMVLHGHAGPALCALAGEIGASAIVLGSRGRGVLKRALLGSVSDHVVRHAPCPVMIIRG
jgi:nucleotide-binding universal stress UspA family protein